MFSLKSLIFTSLFLFFLFSFACKQKQSSIDKSKHPSSKEAVKKPKLDIHTAAFMGDLKTVKKHIKAGSDLNKKDQYGSTPLITATVFGKSDIAKVLIEAGADLNLVNKDGSTALHTAAFFCRKVIVKLLLEKGADKNIKNNFGSTALQSVSSPFKDVKFVYDKIQKDLGPFGLKLDYNYLEKIRPEIAKMLMK